MRRHKIAVTAMAMAVVLSSPPPGVWAGGNVTSPGCLVEKPTGGPEMSGSIAFKAIGSQNNATVDVTLDLKFRNQQTETSEFFNATLPNFDFTLAPEGVACTMLDALRLDILAAFGLPNTKQLKICFSRNPNDKLNCQSISRFDFDFGGSNLGLAIIDRIFVVD
jgi:hypothetical protein